MARGIDRATEARLRGHGFQLPHVALVRSGITSTLETAQGQMDGFFSQLSFRCYLPEVASVGG